MKYVPYEIAKKLKKKGFDEPCIIAYDEVPMACTMSQSPFRPINYNDKTSWGGYMSAPFYQQVIDWLENTHRIIISTDRMASSNKKNHWTSKIINNYEITHQGFGNINCYTNTIDVHNDFHGFDDKYSSITVAIEIALEFI